MDDEPPQDALFQIEGPDERGCVWMHGTSSRGPWSQNLGPRDKVAEVLSQWLGSIDFDEVATGEAEGPQTREVEDADAPPVIKTLTVLTGEN